MKILFTFWFCLLLSFSIKAQNPVDTLPAYVRLPEIPPFSMMKAPDSSRFSYENLKKKRPVIIVVFSPDCGHCKQFTKELLAHYERVKNAQVVMISVLPYSLVDHFYETEKIADYPAITIGSDINNFLGTFFNVRNFPTVCVYNKKGRFTGRLEGHFTIQQVLALL